MNKIWSIAKDATPFHIPYERSMKQSFRSQLVCLKFQGLLAALSLVSVVNTQAKHSVAGRSILCTIKIATFGYTKHVATHAPFQVLANSMNPTRT